MRDTYKMIKARHKQLKGTNNFKNNAKELNLQNGKSSRIKTMPKQLGKQAIHVYMLVFSTDIVV